MKTRLVTATVLAGALALSVSGAQAATPVLDGKKVKTLTLKSTPTAQDNDADLVTGLVDGPERVACSAPRCARLPFVFKPAKGVKGDLAFTTSWTVPGEDMDLYVAQILKDGSATEVAHCGASAGTKETLVLPASTFKAGKTYALIVDFYRTTGQSVTSTVTFPSSAKAPATLPADSDALGANCGL